MKKINYLFAALLFFAFAAFSSCNTTTKPEAKDHSTHEMEEVDEAKVEVEVAVTDTVAVEDSLTKEEETEEQETAPAM